jgi:hypothetical protein
MSILSLDCSIPFRAPLSYWRTNGTGPGASRSGTLLHFSHFGNFRVCPCQYRVVSPTRHLRGVVCIGVKRFGYTSSPTLPQTPSRHCQWRIWPKKPRKTLTLTKVTTPTLYSRAELSSVVRPQKADILPLRSCRLMGQTKAGKSSVGRLKHRDPGHRTI